MFSRKQTTVTTTKKEKRTETIVNIGLSAFVL